MTETIAAARRLLTATLDDLTPRLRADAGDIGSAPKHDGTPVTDADLRVSETFTAAIRETFPSHEIISEEAGTLYDGAEWVWVIDPVDGTSNFTAGLPFWCVSVALVHDGDPVLGVVEAPELNRRYTAERGGGAFRNGRPIACGDPVDWRSGRNAHTPLLLSPGLVSRKAREVRLNPRVLGALALDLCLVADGSAAAALTRTPKVWDIAASSLILAEAGGVYVTLRGDEILPMRAGVDYETRTGPGVAGRDADSARELGEAVLAAA